MEEINGTEQTATPPTTPVVEGDRVRVADILDVKTIGDETITSRISGASGNVIAVRDPKFGDLRVLVRHDDGSMAPYGFDELTVEKPTMVRVTRWTTFNIDMPWPGPEDRSFEAPIKAPAKFVKAFPLMERPKLAGQQPSLKLRMVFLVSPDAKTVSLSFMLARPGQYMQVLDDGGEKPSLLDCVASPMDGVPIAIWQMTGNDTPMQVPVVETPVFGGPS